MVTGLKSKPPSSDHLSQDRGSGGCSHCPCYVESVTNTCLMPHSSVTAQQEIIIKQNLTALHFTF